MFFIYFLWLIEAFSIEDAVGRYITIRLSTNTEYKIGFSKTTDFIFLDKNIDYTDAVVTFIKDGHAFIIKRRSKYLCIVANRLALCKKPHKFDIEVSKLGHRIKQNKRCLSSQSNLMFVNCNDKDLYQNFVLDTNPKYLCSQFIKFPLKTKAYGKDDKVEEFHIEKQLKDLKLPKKTQKKLKKMWKLDRFKFKKFGLC